MTVLRPILEHGCEASVSGWYWADDQCLRRRRHHRTIARTHVLIKMPRMLPFHPWLCHSPSQMLYPLLKYSQHLLQIHEFPWFWEMSFLNVIIFQLMVKGMKGLLQADELKSRVLGGLEQWGQTELWPRPQALGVQRNNSSSHHSPEPHATTGRKRHCHSGQSNFIKAIILGWKRNIMKYYQRKTNC